MEKRVVITGLGAITPIGNNVDETWKGIENIKFHYLIVVILKRVYVRK